MNTKCSPTRAFHSIWHGALACGLAIGAACAWLNAARAQSADGSTDSYSVSETWTVTLAEDNGQTPKFSRTYHGTSTGTLVVSNGNYTLIDKTGLPGLSASTLSASGRLIDGGNGGAPTQSTWHTPKLNNHRVIYAGSGGYEVDGSYPVAGFAGNYAIVQLSFFMVKVQLPVTDYAIPALSGGGNNAYITTGESLDALSGAGDETDQNTGFTASAYSTSRLIPVPPPGAIAPKITTQPQSQSVLLGANASLSLAATGTEPLYYQWKHNGTNLFDVGEFSGSTSSTLTIHGVEAADAGSYSVVVSNLKGFGTSAKAALTIGASIAVQSTLGGIISPDYDGKILPTGKQYQMTATAKAGYVFGGWSGSIPTNSPILSFVLQSNLVLQANFLPNPFTSIAGTYQGLFFDPTNVAADRAGTVTVTPTTSGSFTAKLGLAGKTLSFSGKLSTNGWASNSVALTKLSALSVNLKLDLAGDSLSGSVSAPGWSAPLTAYRAGFSKQSPWPQSAKFTLLIPGSDDSALQPGGDGIASIGVNTTGGAALSGTLADGTAMTPSYTISKSGQWPFYASLYAGKGLILGWLSFTETADSDVSGQLYWVKPAQSGAYYPGGFSAEPKAIGSAYALNNGQIFSFTTGQVWLSEGNMPGSFTNAVMLNNNKATATNKTFSLTLTPATGLFSGSVGNPFGGKLKAISFKGAVLQKQGLGSGYFLGANQSGRVVIEPKR